MYGAVRKSCPARASGIEVKEVQERYDVENSDCLHPKLYSGGPELFSHLTSV